MHQHIVVISGASPLEPHVVTAIPDNAVIIAVDGGLDHALDAELDPTHLVGDLDSITPTSLTWANQHTTIQRHPVDKNHTDTELALTLATELSPARLTLIGGGDRLDHSVAAIGALGHDQLASVARLDGWWDGQHLDVLHGPGRLGLDLETESTLSLLAMHGPCTGVGISGVQWPLADAELGPLAGHGVSNRVAADPGHHAGHHPGHHAGHHPGQHAGHVDVHIESGILTIFDVPHTPSPTKDRS